VGFPILAPSQPSHVDACNDSYTGSPPHMPKMKTHSGAKKRFKLTAKGKVKARHAFTSHILEKKSPKKKRHLGKSFVVSDHDTPRVKELLGAKKK
jgi:large subunit ribosomal protein L35